MKKPPPPLNELEEDLEDELLQMATVQVRPIGQELHRPRLGVHRDATASAASATNHLW
jgi:hypothetical protein